MTTSIRDFLGVLLVCSLPWMALAETSDDASSPKTSSAVAHSVESLDWLTGCWANSSGEPGSVEQWMAPAAGTMLGSSRTVKDGATAFFEFMMMRPNAAGGLEMVAWPLGRQETAFAMIEMGERRAVFENLENDFPHRIIYAAPDDQRLEARIEGDVEGTVRSVEFPMERVRCRP